MIRGLQEADIMKVADYGWICLHCLIDAALGGKHKRLNIGI